MFESSKYYIYSEFASVALVTQHDKGHAPYYTAICGPYGSATLLHIVS